MVSALKSVPKVLYAVLAGFFLALSLIAVTPLYALAFWLGGSQADRLAHKVSRIWASWVLLCCGLRLRVHQAGRINPGQTYVFVSNHRSYLDIPVCARATANSFKFLAKDELTKLPLLGYIIGRLYITVRRQSLRDRVLSLKKMEAELQKGISVWIYPEGTRNMTDNALTSFHDGAFALAISMGTSIAVCTIMDTRKVLPSGNFFRLSPWHTVNAWWETPIETKGMGKDDIPALREMARAMMEKRVAGEKEFGNQHNL